MSPTEAARGDGGVSLAALMEHVAARGERLGLGAIAHVGQRVGRALAEAHGALDEEGNVAPRVHGCVAPDVVRVMRDGEVSLSEAGAERSGSGGEIARYRAPELAGGGQATPRADVFALARIVRVLLGGRDAPGEIEAALARALEPSPARRKITCVELEAWLATLGDRDAGRRELASIVAAAREGRDHVRESRERARESRGHAQPVMAPGAPHRAGAAAREVSAAVESKPLSRLGSALVAGVTAAAVIAAGELALHLAKP